jgi:hypothetical protein
MGSDDGMDAHQSGYPLSTYQASLLEREAAVATAESRVAQYRSGLGSVAADLSKRQDFIEKSIQGAIGPLPSTLPSGTVSDSTEEAGKTVRKVSTDPARGDRPRSGRGTPIGLH